MHQTPNPESRLKSPSSDSGEFPHPCQIWTLAEELDFIDRLDARQVVGYLAGLNLRAQGFDGGPLPFLARRQMFETANARWNLLTGRN